jgi:hypothetical protein
MTAGQTMQELASWNREPPPPFLTPHPPMPKKGLEPVVVHRNDFRAFALPPELQALVQKILYGCVQSSSSAGQVLRMDHDAEFEAFRYPSVTIPKGLAC